MGQAPARCWTLLSVSVPPEKQNQWDIQTKTHCKELASTIEGAAGASVRLAEQVLGKAEKEGHQER